MTLTQRAPHSDAAAPAATAAAAGDSHVLMTSVSSASLTRAQSRAARAYNARENHGDVANKQQT